MLSWVIFWSWCRYKRYDHRPYKKEELLGPNIGDTCQVETADEWKVLIDDQDDSQINENLGSIAGEEVAQCYDVEV